MVLGVGVYECEAQVLRTKRPSVRDSIWDSTSLLLHPLDGPCVYGGYGARTNFSPLLVRESQRPRPVPPSTWSHIDLIPLFPRKLTPKLPVCARMTPLLHPNLLNTWILNTRIVPYFFFFEQTFVPSGLPNVPYASDSPKYETTTHSDGV